jgi:hypothetical protein
MKHKTIAAGLKPRFVYGVERRKTPVFVLSHGQTGRPAVVLVLHHLQGLPSVATNTLLITLGCGLPDPRVVPDDFGGS